MITVMGSRFLDSLLGDVLHPTNELILRDDDLIELIERYFMYSENPKPLMQELTYQNEHKNRSEPREYNLKELLLNADVVRLFELHRYIENHGIDSVNAKIYINAYSAVLEIYNPDIPLSESEDILNWGDGIFKGVAHNIAICAFMSTDAVLLSDDSNLTLDFDESNDDKFACLFRKHLNCLNIKIHTRKSNYTAIDHRNSKEKTSLFEPRELDLLYPKNYPA